MPFTFRMPKELEKSVRAAARSHGVTISEYVRQTLAMRMRSEEEPKFSAYELGKDLFGKYGSGRGDLARNAKQIVREIIRAKAKRSRKTQK